MFARHCLRFLSAALIVAAFPSLGFAAAQLKAGATTSAQPTATSPQLRQIQITFDPGEPSYNVTSFQLSVAFDSDLVHVAGGPDISLVGPYQDPTNIVASSEFTTTPPTNGGIDNMSGLVSGISGLAGVGSTQGGDVDIFSITFTLNDDVSFDANMSFTIFAQSYGFSEAAGSAHPATSFGDDFIGFTNPNDPTDQFFAGPADIAPITITGSFNSFAAQIAAAAGAGGSAAPLPSGLWAGLFTSLLIAASVKFRLVPIPVR